MCVRAVYVLLQFCQGGFYRDAFNLPKLSGKRADLVSCSINDECDDVEVSFVVGDSHTAYNDRTCFRENLIDTGRALRPVFDDDCDYTDRTAGF